MFAVSLVCLTMVGCLYALGYRHRHTPTADQKYGCTVAQQAPNGECQ